MGAVVDAANSGPGPRFQMQLPVFVPLMCGTVLVFANTLSHKKYSVFLSFDACLALIQRAKLASECITPSFYYIHSECMVWRGVT